MTYSEFVKVWLSLPTDIETQGYIPDSKDKFIEIGGYLFVIQNDGNIIFKKYKKPKFTLREVFRCFRLYCIRHNIQFIRIEGTLRRYLFLDSMFPYLNIMRDEEIKDRNVFFVKLY